MTVQPAGGLPVAPVESGLAGPIVAELARPAGMELVVPVEIAPQVEVRVELAEARPLVGCGRLASVPLQESSIC